MPACLPDGVLVQTAYSLISAGTEKTSVATAQASMLGKAKARPDLVRQVVSQVQRQGLWETYKLVQDRLDTPLQLGYSCAGTVVQVGENISTLKPGDRVACAGGGYASHAEMNYIPLNLAAKIPASVPFQHAAFTTLGAIAMQGVRQSNVTLGECVAVIGLGLLGQLTAQILKAAGCHVIAIDIADFVLDLASRRSAEKKDCAVDLSLNSLQDDVPAHVQAFTEGIGADRVIITAGAKDNGPLLLAGEIIRDRGTIVVVGAVPVEIPRSPFYEKEIELRFSRSYGPGRYDPAYEEKGRDYPIGYVRWTEQRNMAAFLQLLAQDKLDLQPLITHVFTLQNAPDAYKMILERSEPFVGILIDYQHDTGTQTDTQNHIVINLASRQQAAGNRINVGFIGLGKFAQTFLLPALRDEQDVYLQTVVNASGVSAAAAMQKNGFAQSATDADVVFSDAQIDTVFIASRHDSHAAYVMRALQTGKNIFAEKPLCLTRAELDEIRTLYHETQHASGSTNGVHAQLPRSGDGTPRLMLGYNRRFAPLSVTLQQALQKRVRPLSMLYRVNAGMIPVTHWIQDQETGGGRILGEVCHFIDYAIFLTGSRIERVFAHSARYGQKDIPDADSVHIQLGFADGSIATIQYLCDGARSVSKEWIEVMADGQTWQIDDFARGWHWTTRKKKMPGSGRQNKGHADEVRAFLASLKNDAPAPIPAGDIFHGMDVTFAVLESLRTGIALAPPKIPL